MSTVRLRLPEYLYESASKLAESENLSISQLITLVLAEKVSLFNTEAEHSAPQRHYRHEVEAKIARGTSLLAEVD